MTKKYRAFLPSGAKIINYSEKATGRDCDICGHTPEKRPPKPGYPDVSEEMRLMRVKLPPGVKATDVGVGRADFTVTGDLIEWNVCKDTANCKDRAKQITNEDGSAKYPDEILARFQ
jgi:hypothetical protein